MSGMRRYRVLDGLDLDNRAYAAGDTVEIADAVLAGKLAEAGVIWAPDADTDTDPDLDPDTDNDPDADTDTDADASPEGGQETDSGSDRDTESRETRLLAAIGALEADNADHWTKKGKPEIRALEALGGLHDVSAKERDAVWAQWQAARAAEKAAAEGDDDGDGDGDNDAGGEGDAT